jgi:HD-like signal output (HDOD) protein
MPETTGDTLADRAIASVMKAIDSPSFEPPVLPATAQQAMAMSRSPDVSLPDLGKLIERDQALAGRFLQVANSVAYRGSVPTTTVSGALSRMGLVNAREVLFFSAVEPLLFKSKEYESVMNELRDHSLATSAACGHLARFKRFSVEDATLAGLVCDLGACAVIQHMSRFAKEFASLKAAPTSFATVLRVTHTVAGTRIAGRWGLPEPVLRVMGEHHSADANSPLIVKLVAAADELTALCQLGAGFDPTGTDALMRVLEDPDLLDSVVDGFAMRLADMPSKGLSAKNVIP